jgi:signal transduction histidine kinase
MHIPGLEWKDFAMKRLQDKILPVTTLVAFVSILPAVLLYVVKPRQFADISFFLIVFAACMLSVGLLVNSIRMTGVMKNDRLARQEEQRLKKAEEELRLKNEELKRLSVYLKNVREEERKYIAREVHDELGQLASALKIDIDWLGIKIPGLDDIGKMRIDHANKTIQVLISSIRKIASSLRPSVLDDFGLNAAIEWQCREFQRLNSIQCIFKADFDDDNLPKEMKIELFRIAQESLTNVMRHSKASQVNVALTENDENIYLQITDDGKGFDTKVKKGTLGLMGLRERAVSIDGELRIESEPGKGTTVLATIPKNRSYENFNC